MRLLGFVIIVYYEIPPTGRLLGCVTQYVGRMYYVKLREPLSPLDLQASLANTKEKKDEREARLGASQMLKVRVNMLSTWP